MAPSQWHPLAPCAQAHAAARALLRAARGARAALDVRAPFGAVARLRRLAESAGSVLRVAAVLDPACGSSNLMRDVRSLCAELNRSRTVCDIAARTADCAYARRMAAQCSASVLVGSSEQQTRIYKLETQVAAALSEMRPGRDSSSAVLRVARLRDAAVKALGGGKSYADYALAGTFAGCVHRAAHIVGFVRDNASVCSQRLPHNVSLSAAVEAIEQFVKKYIRGSTAERYASGLKISRGSSTIYVCFSDRLCSGQHYAVSGGSSVTAVAVVPAARGRVDLSLALHELGHALFAATAPDYDALPGDLAEVPALLLESTCGVLWGKSAPFAVDWRSISLAQTDYVLHAQGDRARRALSRAQLSAAAARLADYGGVCHAYPLAEYVAQRWTGEWLPRGDRGGNGQPPDLTPLLSTFQSSQAVVDLVDRCFAELPLCDCQQNSSHTP